LLPPTENVPSPRESSAEALLREIRLDEPSPHEALDRICRLKGLLAD
jgi:hypothetical protein